jgi:multidrug efflux pump subunit AcrB
VVFIQNENQRIIINTEGQALTIQELEQTSLTNQQGKQLRLKDVAIIEDGLFHP